MINLSGFGVLRLSDVPTLYFRTLLTKLTKPTSNTVPGRLDPTTTDRLPTAESLRGSSLHLSYTSVQPIRDNCQSQTKPAGTGPLPMDNLHAAGRTESNNDQYSSIRTESRAGPTPGRLNDTDRQLTSRTDSPITNDDQQRRTV